jgi:hypothetical protein
VPRLFLIPWHNPHIAIPDLLLREVFLQGHAIEILDFHDAHRVSDLSLACLESNHAEIEGLNLLGQTNLRRLKFFILCLQLQALVIDALVFFVEIFDLVQETQDVVLVDHVLVGQ